MDKLIGLECEIVVHPGMMGVGMAKATIIHAVAYGDGEALTLLHSEGTDGRLLYAITTGQKDKIIANNGGTFRNALLCADNVEGMRGATAKALRALADKLDELEASGDYFVEPVAQLDA